MRDLITELCHIYVEHGCSIRPFDPVSNPTRIRVSLPDTKDAADIAHEICYATYELLLARGYSTDEQDTETREFHDATSTVRTICNHSKAVNMLISISDRTRPWTSRSRSSVITSESADDTKENTNDVQPRPRLSYRLPPNKRGTLGTGYYSVHYGTEEVGKLICDSDDHDPDNSNWRCVLYKGFDPLAYPDKDKYDPESKEPHVVANADTSELNLYSGTLGTVGQTRSWIRSIFDRTMWEQSTVPY
jgi:hypothetical protein